MVARESIRLALLRLAARLPVRQEQKLAHKPREGRRILLIRPDHIGDVLFTTPALRILRRALPGAHIAYLVGEWAYDVVARNENINEAIRCPFPWFSRRPKGSALDPYLLLIQEAKKLRNYGFDVAINLRFDFWWGAMLAHFAGIPELVGYDTAECRPFLTRAVPYVRDKHEVMQNVHLVRTYLEEEASGEDAGPLDFPLLEGDERFAITWLGESRSKRPLILIHPGAGAPVKLWRSEAFAQVGDALAERYGAAIILTGTPSEEALVKGIADQMKSKPEIVTNITIGGLAAILKQCSLVLGADSGVLHLAVAMGVPTVHLYGPVNVATFGPWGDSRRHRVVTSQLPCAPCNRLDFAPAELSEHTCITSISEEQVLREAEALLN